MTADIAVFFLLVPYFFPYVGVVMANLTMFFRFFLQGV